jgi:acyl carrier protein
LYPLDLDGGRARNAGDVRRERSVTEDRKAKIAQYAANARARENTPDSLCPDPHGDPQAGTGISQAVLTGLPNIMGADSMILGRLIQSSYRCELVMPEIPQPEANQELQNEVAGLIVTALNLEISPDDIQPDAPLYGEGLGLDSIDILEVALVVSKQFGFQLRADNADNVRIFSSLVKLTQHIAANRTK